MLLLPITVFAGDLGVSGKTFPIAEPDLIVAMRLRMIALQKAGYFKQFNEALENQARHYASRPTPVVGLTKTKKTKAKTKRFWFFDPTIAMLQNIYSPDGHLLVKAGTHYNPLATINLNETLIFYDADDEEQKTWAKKMDAEMKGKSKLILVNGSVFTEESRFNKLVYFDQMGRLVSRFHIQHVPALVQQAGLRLKIEEVVP